MTVNPNVEREKKLSFFLPHSVLSFPRAFKWISDQGRGRRRDSVDVETSTRFVRVSCQDGEKKLSFFEISRKRKIILFVTKSISCMKTEKEMKPNLTKKKYFYFGKFLF